MTEKLKVSREVADSLAYLKEVECSFEDAIDACNGTGWNNFNDERVSALSSLTTKELATALIVGYEVEMTPHEIIKADYEKALNRRKTNHSNYKEWFSHGYLVAVEDTLATLGITIEGVNDDAN